MEQQKNTSEAASRATILIVEDEPSAREASERYLSRLGYCVTTAASAAEALQRAAEQSPDIAICDWRLGDGPNGVDVARELQQRYKTPVVFVTAHPMDELRAETGDLEVLKYLRKPISLPVLAETIASASG